MLSVALRYVFKGQLPPVYGKGPDMRTAVLSLIVIAIVVSSAWAAQTAEDFYKIGMKYKKSGLKSSARAQEDSALSISPASLVSE